MKATIRPDQVASIREWFVKYNGVLLWTNKDLSNCGAPNRLTSKLNDKGEQQGPPHWSVGNKPECELQPGDIEVETITPVDMPLDWFPVCEHCNGSGKRAVQDLAEARQISFDECRHLIESHEIQVNGYDGDTFDCTWCQGTGHTDRHITVRLKRHRGFGGGYELFPTGEKRAFRLAKRLGSDVKWDWQAEGYGLASLRFYRRKVEPFTLE